ncbi:MAG: response regulator transcription factor [Candidatus Nanopelagicales bacterium]
MTRILVVEDEESIRESLAFLLVKEGYEVQAIINGSEAFEAFEKFDPDLVLLDIMLPGLSGVEITKKIRQKSQTPIIMLTAKDTELDKVLGLEIGADDYVTKPFSGRELLARIKALLRRTGEVISVAGGLKVGPIEIDQDRHQVLIRGQETSMPLKEFELLLYLTQNSGRVLTRNQLIDRIWGSDYFGDTKTLDVHIKRLRARVEKDPAKPKYLQTVRGVGYKFENKATE